MIKYIITFLPFFTLSAQEPAPPGTTRVDDLYVDLTEIANINWLEYMYYMSLKQDSSGFQGNVEKYKPDTTNSWYDQPNLRYAPITYITKEQAEGFCQWRSQIVSLKLGRQVEYRLPSPAEWKLIAKHEVNQMSDREKNKFKKKVDRYRKKGKTPSIIRLESPKIGEDKLYHLFDNVSEMTSEEGIAKGSNFSEPKTIQENIYADFSYEKPSINIGFRCVAEYKN